MKKISKELLDSMKNYIYSFQKENCKSPNFRQIQAMLNISSLDVVQRYVSILEKNGDIERTSSGGIKLLEQLKPSSVTIAPLVGDIACGLPVDSVENIEESYALPKSIFGNGQLYVLKTFGDSMIDIGIKEGDMIVIRKQETAENGDIVVANINGATTLKRFYKEQDKIRLHPENKNMEDIITTECEIQGVLISCIKMFS